MSDTVALVLLNSSHTVMGFDCGKKPLDDWLKKYAMQGQASGAARTYVLLNDGNAVVGYYALAPGHASVEKVPVRVAKGLPRHPIPLIVMVRFAVDSRYQGKGIGRALFLDALSRAVDAASLIGGRAFAVHAKDEDARAFYTRYGMESAPDSALDLYLLFKDIRALLQREATP